MIIDDCFKDIEAEKILQLVILANNKVNLMFQDKQLEQIENSIKSNGTLLKRHTDPERNDTKGAEYLIVQITRS